MKIKNMRKNTQTSQKSPHLKGKHSSNNKRKENSLPLYLYGTHACLAALANPNRICKKIYITASTLKRHQHLQQLPSLHIVETKAISSLLQPDAIHQGIAIETFPLPPTPLEKILNHKLIIILDQVTDPQNIGAILRTAAAFNAGGIILQDKHSPSESSSLAKAACGALEHIPIIKVTNLTRTIETLKKHQHWIVGLDGNAPTSLSQFKNNNTPLTIVLGAEGKGIRPLVKQTCDFLAHIPISQQIESLNVSNAAAICLYELTKD